MRILVSGIGLVAGLILGASLAVAFLPAARFGGDAAPRPQSEQVDSWTDAACLAGVPLFAPPGRDGPDELAVYGVPGDATRPVEVRFDDGLRVVQAHRDVLPPAASGRLASVSGADDAWWHSAEGTEYLVVRHGETLVILSGLPDDALVEVASTLEPVNPTP